MGVLRFYLACVVLLSHCPQGLLSNVFHPGLAVQCFFIISGFYMQLLVSKKYTDQNPLSFCKNFYLSRVFRIFPIYLIILLITIVFINNESIIYFLNNYDIKGFFIYIFSNIFILGQSLFRFFYYDNLTSELILQSKIITQISPANMHALPQSWSLDLELMFYILTPFLLTLSRKLIFFIFVASIVIRTTLAYIGYNYSMNWGYMNEFFPSELAVFLLGAFSYRIYYYIKNKIIALKDQKEILRNLNCTKLFIPNIKIQNKKFETIKKIFNILLYFVIIHHVINFYSYDPFNNNFFGINIGGSWEKGLFGVPNSYFYILLFNAFFVPILFDLSKHSKIDTFIGNLSYPLYLCHIAVLHYVVKYNVSDNLVSSYTLLFSVLLSILLVIFIDKPITKFRHKVFYK